MTPGPRNDETEDDESGGSQIAEEGSFRPSDGDTVRDSPVDTDRDGDGYRTEAVQKSEQDGDWKFPLESLSGDDNEDSKDSENITGTIARNEPLEPGDIDPENAFFVAIGILIVVGLILGAIFGL